MSGMGLKKKLLALFLSTALLPLLLVSTLILLESRDALRDNAVKFLLTQAHDAVSLLNHYQARLEAQLLQESKLNRNQTFLSELKADYSEQEVELDEYVKGYSWAKIVDRYEDELQPLRYEDGFYDFYLIDDLGNILFTLQKRSDLGTNLLFGAYSETPFAQAVQKALDVGKPVFADFQKYAPSHQLISGFVVAPMINQEGEKIGAIALQLAAHDVAKLVLGLSKSDHECRIYLVNHDGYLRTPGCQGDEAFLEKRIQNALLDDWSNIRTQGKTDLYDHGEEHSHERPKELIHRYTDQQGVKVIGTVHDVRLLDQDWGVVVQTDEQLAYASANRIQRYILFAALVTLIIVMVLAWPLVNTIVFPVRSLTRAVQGVQEGRLEEIKMARRRDEIGQLAFGFNNMIVSLQTVRQDNEAQQWLQKGANGLSEALSGNQSLDGLARNAITFLCRYIGAEIGAFYLVKDQQIVLFGSYAYSHRQTEKNVFAWGEGLVGQSALEKQPITVNRLSSEHFVLRSGLGESSPKSVTVYPLVHDGHVVALVEFGWFTQLHQNHDVLLQRVGDQIAITVLSTLGRVRTEQLLHQTKEQAEELQTREEELRENQAALEEKNDQLRLQQDQLQSVNVKLEERAEEIERSRKQLELKNVDLEKARDEILQRAEQLKQASRYKSEFLANMSHELRTPLNSLLILAKLLAENQEGNLNDKQQEYAKTIHDSGSDLLALINDILDLSKIEAGRMDVHIDLIKRDEFVQNLLHKFEPLARDKAIEFTIDHQNVPESWRSDGQKIGQILKNLIGNAIKFTHKGCVKLEIRPGQGDKTTDPIKSLSFAVIDSGIGISQDKLETVFGAFLQADGTTSRKYGGTGLGLAISRELANLLKGSITVESAPGQGSTFTLNIPIESRVSLSFRKEDAVATSAEHAAAKIKQTFSNQEQPDSKRSETQIDDDRRTLTPGDKSLLIIEDDITFATVLADTARDRGFKVLLAEDGENGLYLANQYLPSGIILDLGLPGIDGDKVMQQLQANLETRHIPIHFMTARDYDSQLMRKGAIGFLTKPISSEDMQQALQRLWDMVEQPIKQILLAIDDADTANRVIKYLHGSDIEIHAVRTASEAQTILQTNAIDCLIVGSALPDRATSEFLEWLRSSKESTFATLPVIVYTDHKLLPHEKARMEQLAQSVIDQEQGATDKLLDETVLFLHRVESNLPEESRRMVRMLHDNETIFHERKTLLVDDDMRNIFALSAALQDKRVKVITAKNGREALERLEQHPDTDIVLMDIMMPEMDGYEAMRRIRSQERFESLPIIALTAKAMKGDRALCIDAGASDYLAKPIDIEKLMSMMRVWLYK